MWNKYCKDPSISYDTWSFGGDPDHLAKLVAEGIKTATCSAYIFYELENEKLPEEEVDGNNTVDDNSTENNTVD